MPRRTPSRPMTFTGCWTCKARKVRCDERPIACRNCEKRGISCGGYGIRLQWVSDPLSDTRESRGIPGRRSMKLDRSEHVYETEKIDDLLSLIDKNAESMQSSRYGPFSAFLTANSNPLRANAPITLPERSSSATAPPTELESSWLQQSAIHEATSPLPQSTGLTPILDIDFLSFDASRSLPLVLPEIENLPMDACFMGDAALRVDLPSKESDVMPCPEGDDREPLAGEMAMTQFRGNCGIPKAINLSLFQNSEIDALMSHYNVHVAGLVIPVDHSENPYRRLYLSTAIEGILKRETSAKSPIEMAYNSLYQSLLASAAYHRWYCDQRQTRYREIGAKYRYHAMQSLQDAVQQTAPEANYQVLTMTILSFVTIGVLSGDGDDFRFHIDAASQLRRSRSKWKLLSRSTKQLNEIGAFLAMLSRTLSFQPSSLQWTGQNDRRVVAEDSIIASSSCYEYLYGTTPTLAAAINQTCRLAEHLAHFRQNKEDEIPDEFAEACEEVGNKLQSWQFEGESVKSIPHRDELGFLILTHQAKAWHAAALIYYYTRIQGVEPVDLIQETDLVMQHSRAAEDVKLKWGAMQERESLAPITWPGFIASCNILKDKRDSWRKWWEHMLSYRIANIEKQWEVVQQIWETLDQAEEYGVDMDWTRAYKSVGTCVLPT